MRPDNKPKKFLAGKIEPKGKTWSVQIMAGSSLPAGADVTAVAIVACLGEKILFIRNKRGWDIPGGHVEPTDNTLEETAKRELLEEAGAECGNFKLVGYMISDFYPGRETYIAILKTRVLSLNDFTPRYETIQRRLMSPSECQQSYYGNPSLIEKLLKVALNQSKYPL
jgi:8-oxo-dGTP pyrophosphatase MutT (NUDIX family)